MPTLCVGASLPCVVGLCGPSEAGDWLTHAFFMENPQQSNHKDILSIPISNLPVTEAFKLRSKLMGFQNLNQILSADLKQYALHEDYSERWHFELIDLLNRKGLTGLLNKPC